MDDGTVWNQLILRVKCKCSVNKRAIRGDADTETTRASVGTMVQISRKFSNLFLFHTHAFESSSALPPPLSFPQSFSFGFPLKEVRVICSISAAMGSLSINCAQALSSTSRRPADLYLATQFSMGVIAERVDAPACWRAARLTAVSCIDVCDEAGPDTDLTLSTLLIVMLVLARTSAISLENGVQFGKHTMM